MKEASSFVANRTIKPEEVITNYTIFLSEHQMKVNYLVISIEHISFNSVSPVFIVKFIQGMPKYRKGEAKYQLTCPSFLRYISVCLLKFTFDKVQSISVQDIGKTSKVGLNIF